MKKLKIFFISLLIVLIQLSHSQVFKSLPLEKSQKSIKEYHKKIDKERLHQLEIIKFYGSKAYTFQSSTFTARQYLDSVKSIANNYANDSELRVINFLEPYTSFFAVDDSIDGKGVSISYFFYSQSKGIFAIYFEPNNIFLDTNLTHFPFHNASASLEFDFVDSDVISDSCELNGGYDFRSQVGTITTINYELRNYSANEIGPPDTLNPYWKVSYSKMDSSFQFIGVLIFVLNPVTGEIISKVNIDFGQEFTLKERFDEVDAIAKSYDAQSELKYAIGFNDYNFDGESQFLTYGYLGQNNKKFSINLIFGVPALDDSSGWIFDENDFVPERTVSLNNYLDSDTLMYIADYFGGGKPFRDSFNVDGTSFGYFHSFLDTTRVLFHVIYFANNSDLSLIVLVDPVTGAVVNSILLSSEEIQENIPQVHYLYQNYPNPFNSKTKIKYYVPASSFITLKVYDVHGRKVKELVSDYHLPGNYEVEFSDENLSSGVYFYVLNSGKTSISKKMILLK